MQVKKLHEIEEVPFPNCQQAKMVRRALAGRANTQEVKPTRLAVTPDIMWLIKTNLARATMPLQKKRLMWAVACTLFIGSLRAGEILTSNTSVFVKGATLLNKHVRWETKEVGGKRRNFIKLHLEAPKEDKTRRGVEVELYKLENFFCPVTAMAKWKQGSALQHQDDLPVFRREDGMGYSASELNHDIKNLLMGEIDYSNGRISSHSFRAGITTTMARLGYSKVSCEKRYKYRNKTNFSQEMIGLQGRWRSEAYLRYCKLGRANRLSDQVKLMEDMATTAQKWISGGVLVH